MFQDAQPVLRTDSPSSDILKPTQTIIDVKPSSSDGSQDALIVPHGDVPAATAAADGELCAAAASTDDTDRASSPQSLTGELTGYCIQLFGFYNI